MDRQPVESSAMKSVGYDPKSKTLEVEFPSGDVHQYEKVPTHKAQALFKSKSKGTFFNAAIAGVHKSKKVK